MVRPAAPRTPRLDRCTEPVAEKPKRTRRKKVEAPVAEPEPAPEPALANGEKEPVAADGDDGETPRRGWWQRTFGAE